MAWVVEAGATNAAGPRGGWSRGLQSVLPGASAGGTGARRGGVWDAPTAHPPRATPSPAASLTQSGFLGGLSVKELVTRVMQEVREDDCLGWAAQLPIICCLPSFPFFSF
jgi:hypothetical protein